MEQHEEINHTENGAAPSNRWLIVAVIAALGFAAGAIGYGYHQQAAVQQLSAQAAAAGDAVTQMQGQVSGLTSKLNEVTAAEQAAAEAAQKAQAAMKKTGSSRASSAAAEKRYKELQSQLTDEQKQLKDTQDLVAQNRAELETNLSATRDDLNGSIARTHEELVALERRGQRSYFEFDLNKSSKFQRVGPISISLRKADTKHKTYNLAMLVDDDRLDKNKVNLYEPVWIHTDNEGQPVQIVVNRIRKDAVHGYVSAPKYTASAHAIGSASASASAAASSDASKSPTLQPDSSSPNGPEGPQEPPRRLPRQPAPGSQPDQPQQPRPDQPQP